jgi:hypothetical protein
LLSVAQCSPHQRRLVLRLFQRSVQTKPLLSQLV